MYSVQQLSGKRRAKLSIRILDAFLRCLVLCGSRCLGRDSLVAFCLSEFGELLELGQHSQVYPNRVGLEDFLPTIGNPVNGPLWTLDEASAVQISCGPANPVLKCRYPAAGNPFFDILLA